MHLDVRHNLRERLRLTHNVAGKLPQKVALRS
jgi:hypothetical protein